MEQYRLELAPAERMTVSELTAAIRSTLTAEFDNVWVQGEISGCKSSAYGHCYFTLKDPRSQVRCVCFRNDLRFVKVKPADGLAVVVRGRLDVYEPRGEYQMIVDAISPFGRADLHLAFEQLKERLTREGLFDAERKRALPKYPRRIGIVWRASWRGAFPGSRFGCIRRKCRDPGRRSKW
jgi:exodeoxyribonuclease VII large subunit